MKNGCGIGSWKSENLKKEMEITGGLDEKFRDTIVRIVYAVSVAPKANPLHPSPRGYSRQTIVKSVAAGEHKDGSA